MSHECHESEYSKFLKSLGIDKKQMLASMWSKIPDSEKPSKRGREMTKEYTPEEIKNRLSNIGEAIGNIALDYITKLEKENAELKETVTKMNNVVIRIFSNLTKAKKIISNLYAICKDNYYPNSSVLMKQAEQFLSEVEK